MMPGWQAEGPYPEMDGMAVLCPLCQSEEHKFIGKLGTKFWLRCRQCGADHAAPGWWTAEEDSDGN